MLATQLYSFMDRHAKIIHFKKCCIPVSTETSKDNKLVKQPQIQSQTVAIIFQNFLGVCPRPPSVDKVCMSMCFVHYESTYPN